MFLGMIVVLDGKATQDLDSVFEHHGSRHSYPSTGNSRGTSFLEFMFMIQVTNI